MSVLPEKLGLFFTMRHKYIDIVLLFHHCHDVIHAFVKQIGVIAVHLQNDHRYGQPGIFAALGLVVYCLHIFGIKFLKGGEVRIIALLADTIAQIDQLAHHNGRRMH